MSGKKKRNMSGTDKLEILKDILFMDDREYAEKIAQKIDVIEKIIHDKKKFSEHIDPILEDKLQEYTENIPDILAANITVALKDEIKRSKEDVVDALYPLLGKMVQKSVAHEIKMLSEKINDSLGFKLSFKGIGRKIKSWFGTFQEGDIVLSELSQASIEQVFLIEKGSGILKASFSKTNAVDEELISGVLTAITNFVEDALVKKDEKLELIEYQSYHIHIQNFMAYYVAVVISGNYTTKSKMNVQQIIYDFYGNFSVMKMKDEVTSEILEQEMTKNFGNASI